MVTVAEYDQESLSTKPLLYQFIPYSSFGKEGDVMEPDWLNLPQMSYMEFYQGLRQRNWTSDQFDAKKEKWKLHFFEDAGRFMREGFFGFRIVVIPETGKPSFVNIPYSGNKVWLEDYMAGGTPGSVWRPKRDPQVYKSARSYGYNQVFEQLFQAFEQRVNPELFDEFLQKQAVMYEDYEYDCPGEKLLDINYHWTAPEFQIVDSVAYLFQTGLLLATSSFVFLVVAIGLFKPPGRAPGDIVQAQEFAQSKGRARRDGSTGVTMNDVAGIDYIKQEFLDIIEFLRNPEEFSKRGARPPKGVLLEGGPGLGKTLIAKAVAGEAGVPFYQMGGSEFVEIIVGVGAARIRDLFKRARVNAPCIIFVDEIDAVGGIRGATGSQVNEEREQTLNQLLTEMDGFTPDTGVVFIGATNRADLLDPALLRAGRFDRKVKVEKPNEQWRFDILKVHSRKRPLADDVDLQQVAKDLPGLSGAELANVMNEASLCAIRKGQPIITQSDIYEAIDRSMQGIKRGVISNQAQIKRAISAHEIGKAVFSTIIRKRTGHIEEVERVSLVPRGNTWAATIYKRGQDEFYTYTTREKLLERIAVLLSGNAAEQIVLQDTSTYGAQSIQEATDMAERFVTNYSFSKLGIVNSFKEAEDNSFNRRQYDISSDVINEDSSKIGLLDEVVIPPTEGQLKFINQEVQLILRERYEFCLETLKVYKDALSKGMERLLEKSELFYKDIQNLVDANEPQIQDAQQVQEP